MSSAAAHLSLHCLPMSLSRDAGLKWVKKELKKKKKKKKKAN